METFDFDCFYMFSFRVSLHYLNRFHRTTTDPFVSKIKPVEEMRRRSEPMLLILIFSGQLGFSRGTSINRAHSIGT